MKTYISVFKKSDTKAKLLIVFMDILGILSLVQGKFTEAFLWCLIGFFVFLHEWGDQILQDTFDGYKELIQEYNALADSNLALIQLNHTLLERIRDKEGY